MSGDRELLAAARADIDAIDAELVKLLAKRVAVVDRVIAIKAQNGIPALLPERVEQVVAHARREAEANGAPAELAEVLYRALIAWTVDYEERTLGR